MRPRCPNPIVRHYTSGCAIVCWAAGRAGDSPLPPERGRPEARVPDRLSVHQAVLRFRTEIGEHRIARESALQGEAAMPENARRPRVVDVAVRRNPVHGRIASGLVDQQLDPLPHPSLPPPPATHAIPKFDRVRCRPDPTAGADELAAVARFDQPRRLLTSPISR